MRRWIAVVAALAAIPAVAEELPKEVLPQQSDGSEVAEAQPLEIEPPLLIKTRGPDGLPIVPGSEAPASADIGKLEKDLARATRNAASAERLYKGGIISKMESEERVLRVVRLQASLESARLEEAKRALQEQKGRGGEGAHADLQASEQLLAQAEQAAARAAEERHRAELEAALRNLQRQQKLLALGSGRKADLNRAERKLAELQQSEQ